MNYTYDVLVERTNSLPYSFNFETYKTAHDWARDYMRKNKTELDSTTITIMRFDEEDNYTVMKTGNRKDWIEA